MIIDIPKNLIVWTTDDNHSPDYTRYYWVLADLLHDWLIEHGIVYGLHWGRTQKWAIEIYNPEAMTDDLLVLFKLKFL